MTTTTHPSRPAGPDTTSRPGGRPSIIGGELAALAAELSDRINEHFPAAEAPIRQVLALAEEAGEFVGAYRRWIGMARRTGPWADVPAELADVVITAYITAHALGIDLDAAVTAKARVIFTRGWKDPR